MSPTPSRVGRRRAGSRARTCTSRPIGAAPLVGSLSKSILPHLRSTTSADSSLPGELRRHRPFDALSGLGLMDVIAREHVAPEESRYFRGCPSARFEKLGRVMQLVRNHGNQCLRRVIAAMEDDPAAASCLRRTRASEGPTRRIDFRLHGALLLSPRMLIASSPSRHAACDETRSG